MSIQGTPRLDRDTAERLVAGYGTGPVAVVLRAAAAPAHAEELAGEHAAVAAFRQAAAVAPAPHRSVFRRSVAKALTIKAVLVVAVAGSTGVVLAASEGALPVPWSNSPADVPGTTTPAPNAPANRSGDDRKPPAAPDPAVVGLCEAYTSGADKNLDNPAFRALVEAAGGKGEVAGYCEIVETSTPGAPGPSGANGAPTTTGKPDEPGEDAGESRQPETPPAKTLPSQVGGPSELPDVVETPTEPPTEDKPAKPTRTARTTKTEPTDLIDEVDITETPDSSAPGAASAVPPSGAEPPSKGG